MTRYVIAWVGTLGAADPALAAAIAADLERASYLARVVSDIRSVKAHKLLGNLSNALDLFEGPDAAGDDARDRIASEALAVYAAAGITPVDPSAGLDVGFRDIAPRPVAGQVGGKRSTWQSFARGTSSEVDYLNGEIVLLGRLHGVATPVNERVQRLLGALAASGNGAVARDIHQLLIAPATSTLTSSTPRKETK